MPIIIPPPNEIPSSDAQRNDRLTDQTVGQNLCRLREEKGISQADFAAQFGFTLPQVQAYEAGTKRIGAVRLQKICQWFNVAPAIFFGAENEQLKHCLSVFIDAFLDKTITFPQDVGPQDMLDHMRCYLALSKIQRTQLNQDILERLNTENRLS